MKRWAELWTLQPLWPDSIHLFFRLTTFPEYTRPTLFLFGNFSNENIQKACKNMFFLNRSQLLKLGHRTASSRSTNGHCCFIRNIKTSPKSPLALFRRIHLLWLTGKCSHHVCVGVMERPTCASGRHREAFCSLPSPDDVGVESQETYENKTPGKSITTPGSQDQSNTLWIWLWVFCFVEVYSSRDL